MAHINTVTVQTTEGPVEVTKTSTHRDYVVASVLVLADNTERVLSWHLTEKAGVAFSRSKNSRWMVTHYEAKGIELRPVTITLTGKDKARAETPTHNEAVEAFQAGQAEDAAPEAPVAAPAASAAPQQRECRCGCGEQVQGKRSEYRPGHDARHAGRVAREVAAAVLEGREATETLMDLPTANLIHKADEMSKRIVAKAQAKAAK